MQTGIFDIPHRFAELRDNGLLGLVDHIGTAADAN